MPVVPILPPQLIPKKIIKSKDIIKNNIKQDIKDIKKEFKSAHPEPYSTHPKPKPKNYNQFKKQEPVKKIKEHSNYPIKDYIHRTTNKKKEDKILYFNLKNDTNKKIITPKEHIPVESLKLNEKKELINMGHDIRDTLIGVERKLHRFKPKPRLITKMHRYRPLTRTLKKHSIDDIDNINIIVPKKSIPINIVDDSCIDNTEYKINKIKNIDNTDMIENKIEYIYTDGAVLNNKRYSTKAKGGIGIWFGFKDPRNISKRFENYPITNQRAELWAIISAMEIIKNKPNNKYIIYTDSMYALNILTGQWKAKDNLDLIKIGWNLIKQIPNIQIKHIRAHKSKKDIHSIGNSMADELAVKGRQL
jgi:ribonuclease HI